MMAYRQWQTLREIDLAAGRPKGSGFRLFKRMRARWQEGRDFVVLHHEQHADTLAQLRTDARIYASSVNVVLLHPGAAETLITALASLPSAQR